MYVSEWKLKKFRVIKLCKVSHLFVKSEMLDLNISLFNLFLLFLLVYF